MYARLTAMFSCELLCTYFGGLSGSRASFSQFDARLVSIAELYSRHLQGLLDDLERCSARSCFSKFEYPDGRNTNAGCLGELLLIPVKQRASCSALGRREHISALGNYPDSSIYLKAIDSAKQEAYILKISL
jgi:hypothetical protein